MITANGKKKKRPAAFSLHRPEEYVTLRNFRKFIKERDRYQFTCWVIVIVLLTIFILINVGYVMNSKLSGNITAQEESHQIMHYQFDAENEVDPGTYYLGNRSDPASNHEVEGYAFLLYHPDKSPPHSEEKRAQVITCSEPFGEGVIWKHAEDFWLDHRNDQGLSYDDVYDWMWASMYEWDSKLGRRLFRNVGSRQLPGMPDLSKPLGSNGIRFGYIDDPGVIAFTIVWGTFRGPVEGREIIENHLVFGLDYLWGNATEHPSKMDAVNVGVHEFGHAVGFGHVTDRDASMYPTASNGETKKRTLLKCEIENLCSHYGEEKCPGLREGGGSGTFPPKPKRAGGSRAIPFPSMMILAIALL